MTTPSDIFNLTGKDPRWLELEVCREFQRNKCPRHESECKFGHVSASSFSLVSDNCNAPSIVEITNGRVVACYDSIRGRCSRGQARCKYFHPPPHLCEQLLANGRRYLAIKNAVAREIQERVTVRQSLGQQPVHTSSVGLRPFLVGGMVQPFAMGVGNIWDYNRSASPISLCPQAFLPPYKHYGFVNDENILFPSSGSSSGSTLLHNAPVMYKSGLCAFPPATTALPFPAYGGKPVPLTHIMEPVKHRNCHRLKKL